MPIGMPVGIKYFFMYSNSKKYFLTALLIFVVIGAGFTLALFKKGYFTSGPVSDITISIPPITALPGKVTEVKDGYFTLAVEGDLAPSAELSERIVMVHADTPVLKEGIKKDELTYQVDLEASQKLLERLANLSDEEQEKILAENPPRGGEYVIETASVKDIGIGMDVVVFTSIDVRQMKEFEVTDIRILNKKQNSL